MNTAVRTWARRTLMMAMAVAAAWWAFGPLEAPDLSPPAPVNEEPEVDDRSHMQVALDDAAFHAPLWLAPPPPPAPPPGLPKPAPLPPLKLQLLAIIRVPEAASDEARYRAMLYDPDIDAIIEVAAGATIGDRTVVGVTPNEITLKDRAGTRTLSLRTEGSATGGGS